MAFPLQRPRSSRYGSGGLGAAPLSQRLLQLHSIGFDAAVIDGWDASDLKVVGEALINAPGSDGAPRFVVGGSGVEHGLVMAWGLSDNMRIGPAPQLATETPLLAVSGSVSALSSMQIEEALRSGYVEVPLDIQRLLSDPGWEAHFNEASAKVQSLMSRGHSVIVRTARGPDDPRVTVRSKETLAEAANAAAGVPSHGRLLAARLGALVRRLVIACRPPRVLISGGDTSSAVARALDIQVVEVAARLAPGVPLCRVLESKYANGLEVAFKGGQMGSPYFFAEAGAPEATPRMTEAH